MTNLDYLYDKNAVAKHFGKNHFVDRKLHFKIIKDATVLPHKNIYVNGWWTWGFGGIVDARGEFVKESFVANDRGAAYTPTEDVHYSPETVLYLGMFYPVWGHCITDNIRFMWFTASDEFKKYFNECPQIYLPWNIPQDEGGGLIFLEHQKNFRRLLEILDIDVGKLRPITQPTRFANVILPDESFFVKDGEKFFTNEYRETIDRARNFALKNRTPSAKKVYFFYGRNQVGEEWLAQYFRSKGYEIVSPEKLSLDEQLNVLINAQSFASTLGSLSHNLLFLRDGTEAILIPRTAEYFTYYQSALDQVNQLNVNYVDSSLSIFEAQVKNLGPFCFVRSRELKKFFGDTFDGYDEDDFRIFLEYVISCKIQGLKRNNSAVNYYGATLKEILAQLKTRPDLTASYGVQLS